LNLLLAAPAIASMNSAVDAAQPSVGNCQAAVRRRWHDRQRSFGAPDLLGRE
jgi:hypothetical protein